MGSGREEGGRPRSGMEFSRIISVKILGKIRQEKKNNHQDSYLIEFKCKYLHNDMNRREFVCVD